MPRFTTDDLSSIARSVFVACGAPEDQAEIVAAALVRSNLVGHDSHGVMRIPQYVEWIEKGYLELKAELSVQMDNGPLLLLSGNYGFGQVIGLWAMELAIRRAKEHGFALMGLNQSGHLGRIGGYADMAAAAGMLSLHFVNVHGAGRIVAPYGGSDRRMSANAFAAGVPLPGHPPIIVDVSTAAIAGGKIRLAYNKRTGIPPDCLLNRDGEPTTDPADFMEREGALLHFAGHKGYALGFLCDVLAGALSRASCSHPEVNRIGNAMFTILILPARFREEDGFYAELIRYVYYLKESRIRPGFTEVLYPGEPEARTEAQRAREGITVDENTWRQIVSTAARYGVNLRNNGRTAPSGQ